MSRRRTKPDLQAQGGVRGSGKIVACQAAARRGRDPLPAQNARWAVLAAAALILSVTAAAYSNSFRGEFIFDDDPTIAKNPTIQHLWPIWNTFCPPSRGETSTGRPVMNFTLALNYAVSGLNVWSYHVANLAIHLLSALLLFGFARRTFLLPVAAGTGPFVGGTLGTGPFFGGKTSSANQRAAENMDLSPFAAHATSLALVVALLWAIHPLQTESVTYVVQRAESLVGLFYLLTLYCVVRGAQAAQSAAWWYAAAAIACTLGMASKEVMASAPLIVLLYDRGFLAGSFREAWRRRRSLYLGLAATWLLLGHLIVSTRSRGGSAGFDTELSSWAYLGTQFGAIVHYLRLSVWPRPLVFDYGTDTAQGVWEIAPYAIVVVLLGAAIVIALWRWPKVGFFGAWFLAILAPTSSIVPVATQTIAEHRMYLPLAAVTAGVTVAGFLVGRCLLDRGKLSAQFLQIVGGSLAALAIATLAVLTFQRNADYRSNLSIWQDTLAKLPDSYRAHNNVGMFLNKGGRSDEAIGYFQRSLALKYDNPVAHYNFGLALANRGQIDESIAHYRKALELNPDYVDAHNNLGMLLSDRGLVDEAIAHFQEALRIDRNCAAAHINLGAELIGLGRMEEALGHFQEAVRLDPGCAEAHNNLGLALAERGQMEAATVCFRKALQIQPDYAEALYGLGNVSAAQRLYREAVVHYRAALKLKPNFAEAQSELEQLLATHPEAADGMPQPSAH